MLEADPSPRACVEKGAECTRAPRELNIEAINKYLASVNRSRFEEYAANRQIYIADYSLLQGIERLPERVLYSPIIIFQYLPFEVKTANLVPVGIQLTRKPDPKDNEFFTPDDPGHIWKFAVMHALSADSHYHLTLGLHATSLFAMEPIALAFKRGLAPDNKLTKWLNTHFDPLLQQAANARETFLPPPPIVNPNIEQEIFQHPFDELSSIGVKVT